MSLSLVTGPAVEPITLFEARRQVKAPADVSDDGLIADLIVAARDRAEAVTGRQLILASWDLRLDSVDDVRDWCAVQIPRPPLLSITSIEYIDMSGATQTWASTNYQVDAPAGPFARHGRILPLQ